MPLAWSDFQGITENGFVCEKNVPVVRDFCWTGTVTVIQRMGEREILETKKRNRIQNQAKLNLIAVAMTVRCWVRPHRRRQHAMERILDVLKKDVVFEVGLMIDPLETSDIRFKK